MRLIAAVPALLASAANAVAADPSPQPSAWSVNAELLVGMKYAEKEDFGDASDMQEAGLQIDFRHRDWTFRPCINLLMSSAEDDDLGVETDIHEVQIGVRWYWQPRTWLRLSTGVGFEVTAVTHEAGGAELDEDTDFGVWVSGGAQYTFAQHWHIGVQIGLSGAKAEINGLGDTSVNVGGAHVSLVAGYHF